MTAADLMAYLQTVPPDAVILAASHGDPATVYCRTAYYVRGPYGSAYHTEPRPIPRTDYTETPCYVVIVE